ncbi:MAG: 2-oxoisovalerate dehydrogenase subunit beta [Alphaproteobacteria bacterium MarineAlpha4_Bin2]|nr:MAG: 2-oxoisovalerate dehydrogenase subunit beta [Alphaproteobacteria bacterium MarineAlpha4_Bin2]|tara:strand:+ start:166 stop:1125 length:960 start_codon:yes stop_codon:yes gene_type:complete
MATITYAEAGTSALAEEMRRDPTVFEFCTDATESLLAEFGPARIRTTPITENTFTGMAVGAAGSGYRPVVNWRQVTFGFVAMDPIVNQACKIHYMFGGQKKFPITFRAAVGGGTKLAAQHSQSPYSMFMNLAGLKIILPSTPYDMKGLLKAAIRDDNPVMSFESNRLMALKGEVPAEDYTVPIGKADVKRKGSDITVVAIAWMVHEALAAAETLDKEGVSVEVVDPRTLAPMDSGTIRASVCKTGRLLVADEAGPTAGASAEIVSLVTEDPETFKAIKAPVRRVCAVEAPIPYSPVLEDHVFPNRERIADGIRSVLDTG